MELALNFGANAALEDAAEADAAAARQLKRLTTKPADDPEPEEPRSDIEKPSHNLVPSEGVLLEEKLCHGVVKGEAGPCQPQFICSLILHMKD